MNAMYKSISIKSLSLLFCLCFLMLGQANAASSAIFVGSELSVELPVNPNGEKAKQSKKQKRLEKRLAKKRLEALKKAQKADAPKEGKSWIAALLLSFFLGVLGIHRFYLGYTGIGILMLLTGGVFGILALIDFIRIIVRSLKPKNGDYTD
jgi:TM2 domain-containing membrane protein YozV